MGERRVKTQWRSWHAGVWNDRILRGQDRAIHSGRDAVSTTTIAHNCWHACAIHRPCSPAPVPCGQPAWAISERCRHTRDRCWVYWRAVSTHAHYRGRRLRCPPTRKRGRLARGSPAGMPPQAKTPGARCSPGAALCLLFASMVWVWLGWPVGGSVVACGSCIYIAVSVPAVRFLFSSTRSELDGSLSSWTDTGVTSTARARYWVEPLFAWVAVRMTLGTGFGRYRRMGKLGADRKRVE
ncbi:hypothetical protein EDC01DRAFT_392595 [Geopyxis carbonaria]|nr:hypothetical protein EDC01DRAFT_392595 [Geopyxis carbonaria]